MGLQQITMSRLDELAMDVVIDMVANHMDYVLVSQRFPTYISLLV